MRKLLFVLLLAAAAVPVAATAAKPASVTISLARPVVVFGQTDALSGAVSSRIAGEKVDVFAQPLGQANPTSLATVDSTTNGAWSFVATPKIQTSYQAKWKAATSQVVTVKVRPQITLSQTSPSGFKVVVTAARSFSGKFVLVQRLSPTGALTLKKVVLGTVSTVAAGTQTSATFRVRLAGAASRLRAVMPSSQASPGYIAGSSTVLRVQR
jgi:hypothetical protein